MKIQTTSEMTPYILQLSVINCLLYVTRSRKRGHFAQEFKIELLVLKGRVALKQ